ncbi:MAG: radical SAM protein, partial [Desulfosarcina sp.]
EKDITDIWKTLISHAVDSSLYNIPASKERLSFALELWPLIDFSKVRLKVSYSHTVLRNRVSYFHPFKKVRLNTGKTLVAEKQTLPPRIWLEGQAVRSFGRFLGIQGELHTDKTKDLPSSKTWDTMIPFEAISPGLARYY